MILILFTIFMLQSDQKKATKEYTCFHIAIIILQWTDAFSYSSSMHIPPPPPLFNKNCLYHEIILIKI